MHVIRSASLPVSRWHNGAGRKADIATGEGWLVGFAWLDEDAPFSGLHGFDRTITLVQGPGFTLDIAGRPKLVVDAPFQPAAFDGGAPTVCRIAGPSRVMNVMTDRSQFRHTVTVSEPATPLTLPAESAVARFLVLLRGAAVVADGHATEPLEALDAVRCEAAVIVTPGGNALLATIVLRACSTSIESIGGVERALG